jgi:hypothetical protein
VLFNRRDLESTLVETYKGVETDSQAKFNKETIARAHRRPKWVLYYSAQADLGRARMHVNCVVS